MRGRVALAALLAATLTGVGPAAAADPTATPIDHFVVLMQENHSFDNYFGTFPGADGIPRTQPVPPATGHAAFAGSGSGSRGSRSTPAPTHRSYARGRWMVHPRRVGPAPGSRSPVMASIARSTCFPLERCARVLLLTLLRRGAGRHRGSPLLAHATNGVTAADPEQGRDSHGLDRLEQRGISGSSSAGLLPAPHDHRR